MISLINRSGFLACILWVFSFSLLAQSPEAGTSFNNKKIDGYKGIWFTLGQFSEYGDKYSGGLGTYTAKHIPLAIYAPEVDKTFFVYGGTTGEEEKYLLCMIGVYDHKKDLVSKPTVVYDKKGVDDPHDNPSLLIDPEGYIWVFVSGRGQRRPGFKYRSREPYSIEAFDQISEEEMTYPQPWYQDGKGIFHFFTKYTGVRELYFETSPDGRNWTADQKLAGIIGLPGERAGHYQVSSAHGNKVATFFSRHPDGNVDKRTNLYYLQSTDFGKSWQTAVGMTLPVPLTTVDNAARVHDYQSEGKNVYLKDLTFTDDGNPVCLYLTSGGHEPGPKNDPREWRVTYWQGSGWETSVITTSDHNYDMGSLWIDGNNWTVAIPSGNEPQLHGGGGEVEIWKSSDAGKSWEKEMRVTQKSKRNNNYVRKVINGKAPFQFFWADGNPDEMSQSKLYFGDLGGNVRELPYKMKKDWVRPK